MTSAGAALPVGTGMRGPPLAIPGQGETVSEPVTIQLMPPQGPRSQEPLPPLDGVAALKNHAVVTAWMQGAPWAGKIRPAMYDDSPFVPIEPQEPV